VSEDVTEMVYLLEAIRDQAKTLVARYPFDNAKDMAPMWRRMALLLNEYEARYA